MSDDHAGSPARRPYNRPRRYPVPTPSAAEPSGPDAPAEVTRQYPSLAAAAQDYEQRFGPFADAPTAPLPHPYPVAGPRQDHPPAPEPGHARTLSGRTIALGVGVLAVIAVVGLVLGLSGGSDSTPEAGPASASPSTLTSTSIPTSSGATPSTAESSAEPTSLPASGPSSTTAGLPGGDGSPAAVCTRLGATAPLRSFVSSPRPAAQMPVTYVEPGAGTRVAICVGRFRSGAGAGRGQVAYLAEYSALPATQYAAQLRTLDWVPAPTLPRPTYRNNLTTTVTLVQEGSALVTVVGTGG